MDADKWMQTNPHFRMVLAVYLGVQLNMKTIDGMKNVSDVAFVGI